MSGGGGGPIIIRRQIRSLAQSDTVRQHLTPAKCAELQAITDKQEGDWTRAQFRKVMRFIVLAEADCE